MLVIDDGSRDGTADVARARGVDHVVRLRRNKGLAAAFMAGIDASLKLGADFIVNTDADNQYAGARHRRAARAAPQRRGRHRHRRSQHRRAAAHVVAQASAAAAGQLGGAAGLEHQVPDTTSGFRAYTREAALRMTIVSEFSYTLESIIQAGKKRMAIAHVAGRDQPAHARVAAVRQRLRVHQAVGARRSCASTRCTSRSRCSRTSALRCSALGVAGWRCGSSTTTSPVRRGAGHRAVADPLGGADDRRLPGAADRPARRRDFGQPQAARGPALPRALDRARATMPTPAAVRRRGAATADAGR